MNLKKLMKRLTKLNYLTEGLPNSIYFDNKNKEMVVKLDYAEVKHDGSFEIKECSRRYKLRNDKQRGYQLLGTYFKHSPEHEVLLFNEIESLTQKLEKLECEVDSTRELDGPLKCIKDSVYLIYVALNHYDKEGQEPVSKQKYDKVLLGPSYINWVGAPSSTIVSYTILNASEHSKG